MSAYTRGLEFWCFIYLFFELGLSVVDSFISLQEHCSSGEKDLSFHFTVYKLPLPSEFCKLEAFSWKVV
jgi:hypothetical protein